MTSRQNTVWMAIISLAAVNLGCQPAATLPPANSPAPPTVQTPPASSGSLRGSEKNTANLSAAPGQASPTDDLNSPLEFDLTDEERIKQAADGPFDSVTVGSLTDAVPDALKQGPIGSLGRALFKGATTDPSESDSSETDSDETDSDETDSDETDSDESGSDEADSPASDPAN